MNLRKARRLAWRGLKIGLLFLILLPLLPLYLLIEAIRRNYRHVVDSEKGKEKGSGS